MARTNILRELTGTTQKPNESLKCGATGVLVVSKPMPASPELASIAKETTKTHFITELQSGLKELSNVSEQNTQKPVEKKKFPFTKGKKKKDLEKDKL